MTMVCLNCGADNADDATHCRVCQRECSVATAPKPASGSPSSTDSDTAKVGSESVVQPVVLDAPLAVDTKPAVAPRLGKVFVASPVAQPRHVPWAQPSAVAARAAAAKTSDPLGSGIELMNQTLATFPSQAPVLSGAWRWLAVAAAVLTGATIFVWMAMREPPPPQPVVDAAVSASDDTMKFEALAASSPTSTVLLSPAVPEPVATPVAEPPAAAPVSAKRAQPVLSERVPPKTRTSVSAAAPKLTQAEPLAVAAPVTPQEVQPPVLKSPQESCASKGLLGRSACVSELCSKPAFVTHADCKRLRLQRQLDEEQRLYGGS